MNAPTNAQSICDQLPFWTATKDGPAINWWKFTGPGQIERPGPRAGRAKLVEGGWMGDKVFEADFQLGRECMSPPSQSDTHMAAMAIWEGVVDGRWEPVIETWGNGCIELRHAVADVAALDGWLANSLYQACDENFPGVWQYEVSEELGKEIGAYLLGYPGKFPDKAWLHTKLATLSLDFFPEAEHPKLMPVIQQYLPFADTKNYKAQRTARQMLNGDKYEQLQARRIEIHELLQRPWLHSIDDAKSIQLRAELAETTKRMTEIVIPDNPDLKPFTVIGCYADSGQLFVHHVDAEDGLHAFMKVAEEHPSAEFTAALPGHLSENAGLVMPGESVVDAETVLDQPEVFGPRDERREEGFSCRM